ncbi:MAG: SDR family NAD(P)-dependent oxidoreductase [Deltaproteobacteria bacterium]|nr:SDR family NAD(P)-dependent oxidoreductase [Deltaproteobacteria bacterium]
MSTNKILVTGGTGNIGHALVKMLQADGAAIRVLSRDPARAASTLGAGIEVAKGDLEQPASLEAALQGCARAFFLGHAGPELAKMGADFAAVAKRAGVKHIVAISSGTIEMTPKVTIGNWHLAMEEAIAATGVATTFLRPDNFASNALRWAGTIKGKAMVFSSHVDSQSVPIDPHDIAAVARVALTKPGHAGKIHLLSGPTVMTQREQVAAIAQEIGKPVNVVQVPVEGARAGMIQGGVPAIMADAILELFGHPPRPTKTVQDVTGMAPRAFATWVRENRAAFA